MGADGGVDIRLYQDPDDADRLHRYRPVQAVQGPAGGRQDHARAARRWPTRPSSGPSSRRPTASPTTPGVRFAINRITLLDGPADPRHDPAPARRRQPPSAQAFATEGDWTTPTCPERRQHDAAPGQAWPFLGLLPPIPAAGPSSACGSACRHAAGALVGPASGGGMTPVATPGTIPAALFPSRPTRSHPGALRP